MSDLVTTQVFSNGETGITATKLNNIVGQAAIQTSFVSGQPLASSIGTTDQYLLLTSGGTYARVPQSTLLSSVSGSLVPAGVGQAGIVNALSGVATDYIGGDNACHPLASSPAISLARLRSFNAVGNSTFECDQISVGGTVAAANAKIIDRWSVLKAGTMVVSAGQLALTAPDAVVPGTSFRISRSALRVTLTTAQASLAATDYLIIQQQVEGPQWRELQGDVHSVSLLVRSSVANLTFGLSLRDPATATKSLTKLCTLSTANTWTLISLSNIPAFPSGNFTTAPGSVGYQLTITLSAGTTNTNSANDTWQSNNTFGASGQMSFAAQSTSSTFDIAFCQHEPGSVCTTLIDCPFGQNLDGPMGCTRYYQKSCGYSFPYLTTTIGGVVTINATAASPPEAPIRFTRQMAKAPTIAIWSHATGAANNVRDNNAATDRATSGGPLYVGETGWSGTGIASTNASATYYSFHYTADTGW